MNILLIDDDPDVREIIAFTLESEMDCEIKEVASGNAAINELKQNSSSYNLIVCDYNMPDGNGGVVYQYLLDTSSELPFVFCSSDFSKEHPEFSNTKNLLCEITKPKIFEGIVEMYKKYQEFAQSNSTSVAVSPNTNEYCEAGIDLVANCSTLPCDIYLKVGANMIKTFKQGDDLSQEDVDKYKNKNINSIFVKRSDSRMFVDYISMKIISILEDEALSEEEKVLDAHSVIMETVRELGISDSVVRAASASVDFTLKFFDESRETNELKDIIFGKSKKNYLTNHSVGIAYVSVGILKQTSWDSPENRMKLVMSSFMHDMSIRMPEFTESVLVENSDLQGIKEHVSQTVDMLMNLKNIPEDVFRIISDHHERPDGSGFPRGVGGAQLSPLASIFIFSHDVIDSVLKLNSKNQPVNMKNIDNELSAIDYSSGKFPKIQEAYKKAKIFGEV
ncbi:MAG: response regulator [Bdellovibrionota bacterium]|nr:response regulator [Bdellovibrionota bacterium]